MATPNLPQLSPSQRLNECLKNSVVAEQFEKALKNNADVFTTSLVEIYASDSSLQQFQPKLVALEALRAATMHLPVSKALGYCYIIPYRKGGVQVPQFILGYKGMIQLAMRTGKYRILNDGPVYEGELVGNVKLTGEIDLSGQKSSDVIVGYFAYMETINGFKKTLYASKDDMRKHAKKYSKGSDKDSSPWRTEFDSMARKTMMRKLLSKYGIMSIEIIAGGDSCGSENEPLPNDYANSEVIDMETGEITELSPEATGVPQTVSAIMQDDPGY